MNCRDSSEQLVPYLEGLLDDPATRAVEQHLADCSACRADADAAQRLHERLLAAGDVSPRASLDQAVMDRIFIQQVELTRRLTMRNRIRVFAMSGIAAALLIGLAWAALQYGPAVATAAEIIDRGVEATTNLKSIYLKCRMRTLPADNFEYLDLKQELVEVELWKQLGPPLKWRVEKPGRVAVMNGRETLMVIGNKSGIKLDVAAPAAFDTAWLHRLAAIDGVLSCERSAVSLPGVEVKITRTESPDDSELQTVIVEVETNDQVGDYLKNKFLSTSNTRREYGFDRRTGRLKNARFYCESEGQEVLVLEIVEIQYDPEIEAAKFELQPPEGIAWYQEPQALPDNEKYQKMLPVEVARAFFAACSEREWDEAAKFWPAPLTDSLKEAIGGLEVIKLGEPFQAWPYGGWFVPYEIRLRDGHVRKWNLALRNDNPAQRFVVDGGL